MSNLEEQAAGRIINDEFLLYKGLRTIYYSGLFAVGSVIGLLFSAILLSGAGSVATPYLVLVMAVINVLISAGFFIGLDWVDKSILGSCLCFEAGVLLLVASVAGVVNAIYALSHYKSLDLSVLVNSSIVIALLDTVGLLVLGLAFTRIGEALNDTALSLSGAGFAVAGFFKLFSPGVYAAVYTLSFVLMCYALNRITSDLRIRLCSKRPELCRFA